MEFKLKAVSAVKLLPVIGVVNQVLPGPIEVFYAFYLVSFLLRNILKFKGHLYGKLIRIIL